jgi:transcriptional antiterminator RfaH
MFAWHVALTLPFQELIAERNLARQEFQPFNPKIVITKTIRNRDHTIRAPYIPGYIFIRFEDDDDRWRAINQTRGVRQLMLAAPERPAIVREDAMAILIDRCSGSDVVSPTQVDTALAKLVPVGAAVRISAGPFEGLKGIVRWSHLDRVTVLLSFLGAQRPIVVPANTVDRT